MNPIVGGSSGWGKEWAGEMISLATVKMIIVNSGFTEAPSGNVVAVVAWLSWKPGTTSHYKGSH